MKIITLTICFFAILSCNNESSFDGQLKKNATDYLMKNMNDPKSYESIEWSKVDTTYTSYTSSEKYIQKRKGIDSMMNQDIRNSNVENFSKDLLTKDKELEQTGKDFKPEIDGYMITHKCRAKNAMGALVLNRMRFNI